MSKVSMEQALYILEHQADRARIKAAEQILDSIEKMEEGQDIQILALKALILSMAKLELIISTKRLEQIATGGTGGG